MHTRTQALEIFKGAFGDEHDLVAREIDALAVLYQRQGKHELAEPMHKRALDIRKKNKPNRPANVSARHPQVKQAQ